MRRVLWMLAGAAITLAIIGVLCLPCLAFLGWGVGFAIHDAVRPIATAWDSGLDILVWMLVGAGTIAAIQRMRK
jgi:hypothetical protein